MENNNLSDSKIEPIKPPQSFDKPNAIIAGAIFIFTFIVYYMTVAPTFSFWDCGEFVAVSHILGIPHPPGTPLYVLLGRLAAMMTFLGDPGIRVNLLSVLGSALSATFGYLATVRLIRFWYKDKFQLKNRIVTYIGGLTGALFLAFSNTNWANSVEAEVYAATIMIMAIIYWLTLKYFENKETIKGSKYILMIAYLAILGIGIHLTLFLVFPIAALYFIMKKEAGVKEWIIISIFIIVELFLLFLLSSRPNEIPYFLPVAICLVMFLFHIAMQVEKNRNLIITLGLYLVALYPLYFIIVDAISTNLTGAGLSSSMKAAGEWSIGWIGVVGLVGWGGYNLFQYLISKKKNESDGLMLGIYGLAPIILIGIEAVFRGYEAFMFLTAVIVGLIAWSLWRYINWLILIAIGSVSMIALGLMPFIYGLIGGLILIIILGAYFNDNSWKTALMIILLAAIGFSVNLYTPIRSAHDPIIDENNPETFIAFKNFIERKQYGSVSMTERMFERRSEWTNQFGDHRRMGYWHFFKDQYGLTGPRFFVILLFGFYGLWELIRRKTVIGMPFFAYLLICSAGLVLYMNFADGTRYGPANPYDYLEVRDRDYFFTPAYTFFGLAIGLGIAGIIELVRETVREYSSGVRNAAFGLSCMLILLPYFPIKNNYFRNDQSRNYMPYDYAYNELISCRPNAILISNADNDTFPAWCIQEVYGVRKDVRVVNLSLANTHWYIKQLRDNYNVPISWTDEQIDRLAPIRDREGNTYRVQDLVVDNIIATNKWKEPINVTVTIAPTSVNYRGKPLADNLMIEGMVYYLSPDESAPPINYALTDSLFNGRFQFRGVSDSTIYKNETSARMVGNYAQGFLFMADSLRRADDIEGSLKHIYQGMDILPNSDDLSVYASQLLGERGMSDQFEELMLRVPEINKAKTYMNFGLSAQYAGRNSEALSILEKLNADYPDFEDGFKNLARMYYNGQMYPKLRTLVRNWCERHPDDLESRGFLDQINRINPSQDTISGKR